MHSRRMQVRLACVLSAFFVCTPAGDVAAEEGPAKDGGGKFIICAADVNSDSFVDIMDVFKILCGWGPCDCCPEDVDGSGVVDVDDIFETFDDWGPCP